MIAPQMYVDLWGVLVTAGLRLAGTKLHLRQEEYLYLRPATCGESRAVSKTMRINKRFVHTYGAAVQIDGQRAVYRHAAEEQ